MTATRLTRRLALAGAGAALATATVAALPATPAAAAPGALFLGTYTTLKSPCFVYDNLPDASSGPRYGYTKPVKSPAGNRWQVRVRWTHGAYSLVFDQPAHRWGFVKQSCLTHPAAYTPSTNAMSDDNGYGSHGERAIATGVPATVLTGLTTHIVSHATIRDAARAFVIGNLRTGDTWIIRKGSCPATANDQWVYGYSVTSGRNGYVEAGHIKECRH